MTERMITVQSECKKCGKAFSYEKIASYGCTLRSLCEECVSPQLRYKRKMYEVNRALRKRRVRQLAKEQAERELRARPALNLASIQHANPEQIIRRANDVLSGVRKFSVGVKPPPTGVFGYFQGEEGP